MRERREEARPGDPRATAAVVDLFVYVVVLNLYVEYLPGVLSETFTLSLLTAVLLKVVLEAVVVVKKRVGRRVRQASTPAGKAAAALVLWVVLVGSKFVVLEAVDLVFGPRVSLGGFLPVTLLIVTLLLSRAFVRRLLRGARPAGAVPVGGPLPGAGDVPGGARAGTRRHPEPGRRRSR
ncbi:hypothetical protein ACI8AC_12355 [Geodermatophilus sp. SYSU D00758]